MGILSRHHREKNRVQYESFHLCIIRGNRGGYAKLHLVCSNVCLRASTPYDYGVKFSKMVTIYSAAAGGNYIIDATNLIEFLPASFAWLVTFLAVWWAVGYTVSGLLAWGFMSNYSCNPEASIAQCTRQDNMG